MKLIKGCRGCSLPEVTIVLSIVLLLTSLTVPSYIDAKGKAQEAEVKQNLHSIQIGLERFAVDADGSYPCYLIGGEPRFAAVVQKGAEPPFAEIRECEPAEGVSDVLLRRGYLTSYPRNPFSADGWAIHDWQENMPTQFYGNDPLRNGCPDAEYLGTRFGADCSLMGAVLADPRFQVWLFVDTATSPPTYEERDTWCNVEYPFWDCWASVPPQPFLPGQFFYKVAGPLADSAIKQDTFTSPCLPTEARQYILGAYGGLETKGLDVLGAEQPIDLNQRPDDAPPDEEWTTQPPLWTWTRSEVSGDPKARDGSPYRPAANPRWLGDLEHGNPNGIEDAIIIVLAECQLYPPAGSDTIQPERSAR